MPAEKVLSTSFSFPAHFVESHLNITHGIYKPFVFGLDKIVEPIPSFIAILTN